MARDRLAQLLEMQRQLQIGSYGMDPAELMADERADFFRTMTASLIFELGEASNEIGWKPWAYGDKAKYLNREPYLKELVDAFHFFMNLWLLAGGTPDELFEMYMAKRGVNERRQLEGYDGQTSKCRNPDCRRALDDYPATRRSIDRVGEFHTFECWLAFADKADVDE